jgi:hypothetical protein
MRDQVIDFRGTYRYATQADLERALVSAREGLDDDAGDHDIEWLDSFVRVGSTLLVNAKLPLAGDRFVAACVLEALANHAIAGVVEATRDGRFLDWFPSRA